MDNNWKSKTLENISVKKGLVRGPFGGTLKKAYFKPQGYKVYEQKNAINKSISLGNYFVDRTKYQELERFHVKENDFIVSCSGTIGKIYQIPKGAPEGLINQALLKITLDNTIINNQFFYQYFQWQNFQRKIIDSTQGGAMPNLVGMKIFKKTKVNVPPIEEQEKIANILSTWDKAIELKQQLIDLKKEQKKGLMQKLLTGEVRLPGFSSKWEEKNLKDISNITMGQSPKSKSYNSASEGLPLIQGNADIKNRKTNPSNWTTQVTKECNVGDIILTVRAPVGTVAKSIHNACIGRGVCAIKAKNCQMFLYQVLLLLEKKWVNLSQGSTFESINSTEIRNFKISIPTPKEQEAIARVLSRADSYIELLENEVEILKEQKKGLMQQLLTGKTRVKV